MEVRPGGREILDLNANLSVAPTDDCQLCPNVFSVRYLSDLLHIRRDNYGFTVAVRRVSSKTFWAVAMSVARVLHANSKGRRPIRSESAPITGSQNRLDAPTHSVTIRLSMLAKRRTEFPNVGVSAVIM